MVTTSRAQHVGPPARLDCDAASSRHELPGAEQQIEAIVAGSSVRPGPKAEDGRSAADREDAEDDRGQVTDAVRKRNWASSPKVTIPTSAEQQREVNERHCAGGTERSALPTGRKLQCDEEPRHVATLLIIGPRSDRSMNACCKG